MKEIHLIDNAGQTTTMSWEELRMHNETSQNKYSHDIEWYLNNGYSLIDDVIEEFEEIVENR